MSISHNAYPAAPPKPPVLLDCTLRDGGYYNHWDFSPQLVEAYIAAMSAAQVDVIELGLRNLSNKGFKGAHAYSKDDYLRGLSIPEGFAVAVMVNGSDLCTAIGCVAALEKLFPEPAQTSPVSLVRIACHFHELRQALPAAGWLAARGYRVGVNLMQIADRSREEVAELTRMAKDWPLEVLYFADSMGSMGPDEITRTVDWLRDGWPGDLGIHTHDNMGLALSNTLRALQEGVTWLDATVTGMGRGPGNARIEELAIEAEGLRNRRANLVPLLTMIQNQFAPMKAKYGWGTNPYYYLAGKYGIHPTYIQEMLGDARYSVEDAFAVIDHLRDEGGKKFSYDTLKGARQFYDGSPRGSWKPAEQMADREVLIMGTGPGAATHRAALEAFIGRSRPLVLALNTQTAIAPELIDLRIACHPVRLLADAEAHAELPQPLITPASMLPDSLRAELGDKPLLDYGLGIETGRFEFHDTHCLAPCSLVMAYALAVATSGRAKRILMAGFDGYDSGDPRNEELERILELFIPMQETPECVSITPTRYLLASVSVYAL